MIETPSPPPAQSLPIADHATPGPAATVPWISIGWFGALFCLLFGSVLLSMANDWMNDESMGHGFFVPLIAGYIAYQDRDKIIGQP